MSDQLEPIDPADAVEMYLDHREPDVSEKTHQNHRYRLEPFVQWCDENGIESLHELTGRDLHKYRVWRSEDIEPVTLQSNLATVRVFLGFAESIEAVEDGLREKVVMPNIDREDETKNEMLETDRAEAILDYLERYQYAGRDHIIVALFWHTGIRLGTLRALDVNDVDLETGALRIRHRPDTGTPLKNKQKAERHIAIGDYYVEVLEEYIDHRRHEITDDHGRKPLITSKYGRLTEPAIRTIIYQLTRPCMIVDCPHDEDPKTCEYMSYNTAGGCPSSRSPHGVRRGAMTRMLREGVPEEIVGDRSNSTKEVLEQHYDQRTERERMELRREFIDET
jgi:site-specific recombinase XerD